MSAARWSDPAWALEFLILSGVSSQLEQRVTEPSLCLGHECTAEMSPNVPELFWKAYVAFP